MPGMLLNILQRHMLMYGKNHHNIVIIFQLNKQKAQGRLPTTKTHPTQNVNRAAVENPAPDVRACF